MSEISLCITEAYVCLVLDFAILWLDSIAWKQGVDVAGSFRDAPLLPPDPRYHHSDLRLSGQSPLLAKA